MRVSVFTPTNDPRYLADCHRSLAAQTVGDWEWVVVPNGPGGRVPDEVAGDPRVKVHALPAGSPPAGIGYLKKFACSRASGDLLVELDHDDLLAPEALERLVYHALESRAGFLYSDFAQFLADGSPYTFPASCGWETYPATMNGNAYTAMAAFEPCPAALSDLSWAPNHVRAWTREAYAKAGGHDPGLAVADDFDLICKTWLAGVEFRRVAECLYFYRERREPTDKNTYLVHPQLTTLRQQVSNKYTYPVLAEWCRRRGLLRVDLGCGSTKPAGMVGVDLRPLAGVDVVHDLRRGLPFADGSVGQLRAQDFLEHLRPGGEIVRFFNEAYRVLAPGGWLTASSPSTDGRGAWQDPTHTSGWNCNSWWYYTDRHFQGYVEGLDARFQATRQWDDFPSAWHTQHNIAYTHADLACLKGQRQPGECRI